MNVNLSFRFSSMLALLFIFFSIFLYTQDYRVLSIQGNSINIYQKPNPNSKVLLKLNKMERCAVLKIGDKETVAGKEDYWYKVKYSSKTGWVFGAFTSLRQEGRKSIKATFKDCFAGDVGHLLFTDNEGFEWDFGQGPNNLSKFEFCIDPEQLGEGEPNPKYLGKVFSITYTINKEPAYLESDGIIDCPTIIEIKLLK